MKKKKETVFLKSAAVCVCVCVCEREREKKERERGLVSLVVTPLPFVSMNA